MIYSSDALDRLRGANPVPSPRATVGPPDPVLFHRIVSGATTTGRGPVRRRRQRLVPVLVVSSLLAAGTAYALRRGTPSKPHNVACYEAADLDARTEVVRVDHRGPVEACADLWRRGALGPGGPPPVLVQCLLESGVAGVFPSPGGIDVCPGLTIPSVVPAPAESAPAVPSPPLTPAPVPDGRVNARFLAFRDAVLTQFLASACVEPGAGVALVRRELDAVGLTDWVVERGEGFSTDRPCATLFFRPELREVVLVPAPPRR